MSAELMLRFHAIYRFTLFCCFRRYSVLEQKIVLKCFIKIHKIIRNCTVFLQNWCENYLLFMSEFLRNNCLVLKWISFNLQFYFLAGRGFHNHNYQHPRMYCIGFCEAQPFLPGPFHLQAKEDER